MNISPSNISQIFFLQKVFARIVWLLLGTASNNGLKDIKKQTLSSYVIV